MTRFLRMYGSFIMCSFLPCLKKYEDVRTLLAIAAVILINVLNNLVVPRIYCAQISGSSGLLEKYCNIFVTLSKRLVGFEGPRIKKIYTQI